MRESGSKMTHLVTVFGGGGFVGRYVVEALLRAGHRVRVAERHPKNAYHLKAQANLGQLQFLAADVTRAETIARALQGATAAINLVGVFGSQMDAVQREGAGNVAQAASAAGLYAFVHMSAIGADPESASAYGRSKGAGEQAVLAAFPNATILRPSIIFGREDQFVNRFASLIRMAPVMPVIGGKTKFQPVHVGDVARAAAAAVAEPGRFGGKTFELGGPQILSMRELNEWIAQTIGVNTLMIDVPDAVAGAMATATGWLPGAPITRDQWLMLQKDNIVAEGAAGLGAFGIAPISLDMAARGWLVLYKNHGRFGAKA
jgi:uncharacterized protein YbjT (DUF2867 family)